MSARAFLFLLGSLLPLLAADVVQPVVVDAVQDRFIPAPYDVQKIEGLIGERLRVNLEGRLLHIDEKGLLEGFQQRPGKQVWIGEHAGKFLHAACNTWLYTHDARLKSLMDRMARALIAEQLPDGYLGTYTDDKRWTAWDVWVHKYDLIGLLSYYQATGYQPALVASRKIGDLLSKTFGNAPGERDIIQSSTHVGMAATSVLEPMVMLYRYTGDKRHLDFCNYILLAWNQSNGPKIIPSLLDSGSVFKTANAKAYEMMSDLVGLLELYRLTGNSQYLRVGEIAWNDISSRRLYITGTASAHEYFKDDLVLPGEDIADVGEGCATVTWLQMSWQLLRLTGDVKYAGEIERTVYNQLLGAQDPRNGDICYFTPLNGRKAPTPGINCCVSSGPRGISMLPQTIWGSLANGVAVLQYVPGQVKLGGLTWKSETRFPLDGKVSLSVLEGSGRMPVSLRVPAWTASYRAKVGADAFQGKPGELVTIDRGWKPGDRIDIDMDMTVRVLSGGPSYPFSVAVQRGPQVLALEQSVNSGVADLQIAGPRSNAVTLSEAGSRLPATWPGKQAYAMEGVVAGKPRELILVPFADARSYRVWIAKPQ